MSLTSIIKSKGNCYQALKDAVNLDYCLDLIKHQNNYIQKPTIKPPAGTNCRLSGMGAIYALRDYLFGKDQWHETVAGRMFKYPEFKHPERWILMAIYDNVARTRSTKSVDIADYDPTMKDINNIAMTFKEIIGKPKTFLGNQPIYLNPNFTGSPFVGGADANMIIGDTLWEIKTTTKTQPLTLDAILQQIGYVILDYENEYNLKYITWYYTRQKVLFTHPIGDFISKSSRLLAESKIIN